MNTLQLNFTATSGGIAILLKPSTWLRAMWFAVAALHAWLVLRRFINGHVETIADALMVVLCMFAIWYASRKAWKLATLFDSQPKRALIFTMTLMFGHVALQAPVASQAVAGSTNTSAVVQLILIAPVLLTATTFLILGASGYRRDHRESQSIRSQLNRILNHSAQVPPRPLFSCYRLFDMPPPSLG